MSVSPNPKSLLAELVTAHRILVAENVLDAFGHISVRDPQSPDTFWLARALPPSVVEAHDFLRFDLSGDPVAQDKGPLFAERYIHSAIYRARPDVHSVCHHHAVAIMPFCLTDRSLVGVSQTGAFLGNGVPVWDSATEFGATRMVVETPDQAASLATALGSEAVILMRGHGATVVGCGIRDTVFRSVYACKDAQFQYVAAALGPVNTLSEGELELGKVPSNPAINRCWTHLSALYQGTDQTKKGSIA